MAKTKDSIMRNKVRLESSIVIHSSELEGIVFSSEIDLAKTARNKGTCPMLDARIITKDPKRYFQNLFSGLYACSINIVRILLTFKTTNLV